MRWKRNRVSDGLRQAGRLALLCVWLWSGLTGFARAQGLPEVISAGVDQNIKRWDSMGRLASAIGTHDDTVTAIALVPGASGKILVSVGADGKLKIWEVPTSRLLLSQEAHNGRIQALAVSPDGKLIATGGSDQRIRLWLRMNGKRLCDHEMAHVDMVRSLHFTENGNKLISASADRTIRAWKIQEEGDGMRLVQLQTNIPAHDEEVTATALSSDGRTLASVSADGFLKTWMLDTGVLDQRARAGERNVLCVTYAPDGKTIATGDEEGRIRLWDAMKGAALPFQAEHDKGAIRAIAFSSDGKILVTGGEDKFLRYWNVMTGKEVARVAAHESSIRALLVLP